MQHSFINGFRFEHLYKRYINKSHIINGKNITNIPTSKSITNNKGGTIINTMKINIVFKQSENTNKPIELKHLNSVHVRIPENYRYLSQIMAQK